MSLNLLTPDPLLLTHRHTQHSEGWTHAATPPAQCSPHLFQGGSTMNSTHSPPCVGENLNGRSFRIMHSRYLISRCVFNHYSILHKRNYVNYFVLFVYIYIYIYLFKTGFAGLNNVLVTMKTNSKLLLSLHLCAGGVQEG